MILKFVSNKLKALHRVDMDIFKMPWAYSVLSLLFISPLWAQSTGNIPELARTVDYTFVIERAQRNYESGNFAEVLELLEPYSERDLVQSQKVEVHRLLAKTYLATDYFAKAERSVRGILKIRPNFEPYVLDPPQFIALVDKVKREFSTQQITSVSKRSESLLEAPATVVLLTEEQIKRRGYSDLEALLYDLSCFDISRANGATYANIYQRGYRSNSTDRTLFLIDGVEDNDLWSNITYLSRQYPLSNIKRVEIIYGPASTMYGANAFLGVINIITKEPEELLGTHQKVGIQSQLNLGTWNTRSAELTFAGKYGGMSFLLTSRIYQTDETDLSAYEDWDYQVQDMDYYREVFTFVGEEAARLDLLYPDHDYFTVTQDADGKATKIEPSIEAIQKAMDYDEKALRQNLPFANTTNDWLVYGKAKIQNLILGFQTWRREEGSIGWYKDDFRGNSRTGAVWTPQHTFFYVKYDQAVNDELSISSFTRFRLHDFDEETEVVQFNGYAPGKLDWEDLMADSPSTWTGTYFYQLSRQVRSEWKFVYEPRENFNIISGMEFRSSLIQGDYLKSGQIDPVETGLHPGSIPGDNHFNSRDLGLYAQASYNPIKKLKLVFGQRVDNNKIRTSGGNGTVFNSRIGIVSTPGNWIIKGIFAQAFKDADNFAKYGTVSGKRELPNPTLKPERVNNFEVSAGYQFTQNLFAEIVRYSAYYTGAIGEKSVPYNDSYTLQNQSVGSYHITGVQSQARFTLRNYTGYANYTYTHPLNTKPLVGGDETQEDLRIGDIASHQFNLGINALYWDRFNVNLRLNYVGMRETGESTTVKGNPEDEIDPYTIFNTAITYQNLFGEDAAIQLVINNLFDTRYFHPGIRTGGSQYASKLPQNERNMTLKLLIDY